MKSQMEIWAENMRQLTELSEIRASTRRVAPVTDVPLVHQPTTIGLQARSTVYVLV